MSHFSNCIDCRIDTCPPLEKRNGRSVRNSRDGKWEHYMVHPHIWEGAGLGPDAGYMCIGCLEGRLGRELLPMDFIEAPINQLGAWDTRRLLMRKLGLAESDVPLLAAKYRKLLAAMKKHAP